jgi:hypothetical protein
LLSPRQKRQLYVLAPLLLLLLCLTVVNLAQQWSARRGGEPVTQTAVQPAAITPPPPTAAAPPVLTPSPTAVPSLTATAEPTPLPTFPADSVITLLGPPPDSTLTGNSVTFYWRWSLPLDSNQQFAVYLFINGQETLLGILDEPNVGSDYRLHASPLAGEMITARWQVRLETTTSINLAESEQRSLTLLAGQNILSAGDATGEPEVAATATADAAAP